MVEFAELSLGCQVIQACGLLVKRSGTVEINGEVAASFFVDHTEVVECACVALLCGFLEEIVRCLYVLPHVLAFQVPVHASEDTHQL